MINSKDFIKTYIQNSIHTKELVLNDEAYIKDLQKIIEKVKTCFKKGNKILVAGNGGSAADAQHFTAEFMGRYLKERKAYPALALTTDSSMLTAWSNDYSYDTVFSRQIEGIGEKGDVFFGITTSGNSKSILEAIKAAKKKGIFTVGLTGRDGGKTKDLADISLIIPSDKTSHIQECHIMTIHIICEEVEKYLV